MPIYPLKFNPIFIEKIWGGRRLANQLGKNLPLPESRTFGESWELSDLPGHESTIANGPHAGRTLFEIITEFGSDFLGDIQLTPDNRFPLLIKFLDAHAPLSVQVHPSSQYVNDHPDSARIKNEAWYIIDADENAVIYRGIRPGISPEAFAQHVKDGPAVIDDLVTFRATPNRCFYIPSGTVHAIGPGILLAEIQTTSDDTFRLHDWGRIDRPLHIKQALQCATIGPCDTREIERRSHVAGAFTTISRLCDCEDFRIEKVRMSEGYGQEIPYNRAAVWIVLKGEGVITNTPAKVDVEFSRGEVLLLPAGMDIARVDFEKDSSWLEIQPAIPFESTRLA